MQIAIQNIKTSFFLPIFREYMAIRNQIIKSGTNIGVNYREENRARSKSDFANKIKEPIKEACEILTVLQ